MKLYHYTTFANFCSIWIQQKLKFSEWGSLVPVPIAPRIFAPIKERKGLTSNENYETAMNMKRLSLAIYS
jgi:hypothetical protein